MSVSRKENGSLVKKAGRAVVDLALSLTSNHAVANSAVTEAITEINNDLSDKANISLLTANSKTAQLAYSNNKYGFTINGIFYEIGGGGMPFINWGSPLKTIDNTTWTATQDCYLFGRLSGYGTSCTITINGTEIFKSSVGGQSGAATILPLTPVKAGQQVSCTGADIKAYKAL